MAEKKGEEKQALVPHDKPVPMDGSAAMEAKRQRTHKMYCVLMAVYIFGGLVFYSIVAHGGDMAALIFSTAAFSWAPLQRASVSHARVPPVTLGILKGIDPVLTADALFALRAAGHGDVIAVVDANFPAASTSVDCVIDDVIQLAGVDCTAGLAAIGSVLPLDLFVEQPVGKMVPSPGNDLPPLGEEVHKEAISTLGSGFGVEEVERFAFYARAKDAFAVFQCSGERRPYGCFLLTKGVVGPDGNDLAP